MYLMIRSADQGETDMSSDASIHARNVTHGYSIISTTVLETSLLENAAAAQLSTISVKTSKLG